MTAVSRAGGSRDGNCAIGHGLRGVKVPLVLGSVEQLISAARQLRASRLSPDD